LNQSESKTTTSSSFSSIRKVILTLFIILRISLHGDILIFAIPNFENCIGNTNFISPFISIPGINISIFYLYILFFYRDIISPFRELFIIFPLGEDKYIRIKLEKNVNDK